MNIINYAELAGLTTEGFDQTEVIENGSTTTIYGGKANVTDPVAAESRDDWKIRRTVITEDNGTTTIVKTWATGPWTDRATLTYKYL